MYFGLLLLGIIFDLGNELVPTPGVVVIRKSPLLTLVDICNYSYLINKNYQLLPLFKVIIFIK